MILNPNRQRVQMTGMPQQCDLVITITLALNGSLVMTLVLNSTLKPLLRFGSVNIVLNR